MAEIKLNKPLYSDEGGRKTPPPSEGSSADRTRQPPPPRPPRPPLWMRVAALAIDLLLLHGVALLVLKLAFEHVVRLGLFGPFVGLTVALLYLAMGYSSLTEGRTVGKLVMRLQVNEPVRGFLGFGQSLLRSMLLLWPLYIHAAIELQVERMAAPDIIAPQAMLIKMAGFAVAAAWYLGNFFHAWYDPHGRSWIDRLARTIEISTEASDEDIQSFLRSARETVDPARAKRAMTALIACVVAIVALDLALSYFLLQRFRILTNADRADMLAERRSVAVPGFPLPIQMAPEEEITGGDEKTTQPAGVQFQYRRRTPFEAQEAKAIPEAITAVDRITSAIVAAIQRKARETTGTQTAAYPGEKARIQVGFAEYADLFFADQAVNVYSEARTLDIEQIRKDIEGDTAGSAASVTPPLEEEPRKEPPAPAPSPVVTPETTTATAATTGTTEALAP